MIKDGFNQRLLDVRLVYKMVLENTAVFIILYHNDPTGNLNPSQANISLTKKIKSSDDLLNICSLDHLIITQRKYYRFADEGKL
ncbi:MAG: JAB domain-containing protein [Flavobacteriales bacterium AspAUS03]